MLESMAERPGPAWLIQTSLKLTPRRGSKADLRLAAGNVVNVAAIRTDSRSPAA